MKLAALSLWVIAACADHAGAYLEVHGGSITFDHVEFYFGRQIGTTFGTPAPNQTHVTGKVYARQLADSDLAVAAKTASSSELTYYVPASNTGLGQYVMVIATKDGTPVGIGDASDFVVPSGGYSIVNITLETYDHVETWQATADPAAAVCLAWDRPDGEPPIAFVPEDDHDCDGEVTAVDCDDAAFCHSGDPTCQPARELCTDNTCAYGCMIQDACVPRVCVPSFTCTDTGCENATTLTDKFTCLLAAGGGDHPQYFIGASAGEPCAAATVAIELPDNRPCTNPVIEFQQSAGGWTFAIADGGNSTCILSLATTSSNTPFGNDRHVLISLDPTNSQDPRPTIFLGVGPDSSGCDHTMAPIGTLVISDCH